MKLQNSTSNQGIWLSAFYLFSKSGREEPIGLYKAKAIKEGDFQSNLKRYENRDSKSNLSMAIFGLSETTCVAKDIDSLLPVHAQVSLENNFILPVEEISQSHPERRNSMTHVFPCMWNKKQGSLERSKQLPLCEKASLSTESKICYSLSVATTISEARYRLRSISARSPP